MSHIKNNVFVQVLISSILTTVTALIILFGGLYIYQAQTDATITFTIGDLTEFSSYFGTLVWPIMAIGQLINLKSQGQASAKRITDLLDEELEINDDLAIDNVELKGNITINKLSFKYPDSNVLVLKNLSFEIKQGEIVGIMGATGCGKTTLVDLLVRMYNVSENRILFDGVDILNIPLSTLRTSIAYVNQESFLFKDTIASNICFSLDEVDKDLAKKYATLSDVDKDIEKYGYPYSNRLLSKNRDMYFSTTTGTEDIMSATSITFERSDNTLEYFHDKLNKASGYSGETKIAYINFGTPIAKGLLQIQNNEILDIAGGITVYYKDKILRNGYVQLGIVNEQHGCSFEFYNLSNLEVLLNESVGIALNGNIKGLSGEFAVSEGRMISTSPSSQKELYIGAQKIVLEGENLNVEYTFNSDTSEMVVKGNPNKARLENIDIMEGWVQFFLTNWAAIIMAFIGTIMSVSVENIGKKE